MLVRQFAQPLACLRELIQNSIDAGSNQIDVEVCEIAEDECFRITVIDTGEGMTEDIIQTQLTRLFNSAKENDFTKVGKFGIGFVSVFALEPMAVVVDTGRDGQHWRVLFHADCTFDLIRHDGNVEGTRVEIYLARSRFQFASLLADVEKTLHYWCRHCRAQISVNGKPIHQPFELEAPLTVVYEEPGTRLVAGLVVEARPFFGYYNQGLTLLEGNGGPLPFVTFKMDSRYFEHTLTRDNLIENEDFHKAIAMLRRVMSQDYPKLLFERLRQEPAEGPWNLLDQLHHVGLSQKELEGAPLVRDHQGMEYSLAQLRSLEVYFQEAADALQAAVHDPKSKRVVLALKAGDAALKWLKSQQVKALPLDVSWGVSVAEPPETLNALRQMCQKLGSRFSLRQLVAIRWLQGQPKQPLIWQAPAVGAVRWDRSAKPSDALLFNVAHPTFEALLNLSAWSPTLAGQIVLQHLLLLRPDAEREEYAHGLAESALAELLD